tara:strand:- start:646 stop:2088 length:1443 start_codon:yes stop_codon:yes gene_type:complete
MNFKKLFTIAFATLFMFSCQEEFIDDPKPVDGISESLVFSSRSLVDSFLAGMLRRSRGQFTGGHDAGGINSMYYARVVKGNDIIQKRTWFLFDYDNDNREPNYRRPTFSWQFPYFMINQANIAIRGINNSDLSETDKNETLAQAMGIRAFYYFQLALEFCPAYLQSSPASEEAPPIYTEPATEGGPMSTLQEMYDLIISDLTTAISKASDSRIDKSFINSNVLHGILSRVYLTTGNYAGAAAHAAQARVGYPLAGAEYVDGFDNMSATEWIWGMPQQSDQSNYYYGAPHMQADHENPSYAGTFINRDFFSLFSTTDIRSVGTAATQAQFYARYTTNPAAWFYIVTRKFTAAFTSHFALMRSAEMVLTEAEGKARTGDDSGATALLLSLQQSRDPNAVASGNTGQALVDEILVEKRKELYSEIGVEWFDAKRLGKAMTRTGNHRVMGTSSLTANDKRFFLKVPQREIDANDNITDAVNANR